MTRWCLQKKKYIIYRLNRMFKKCFGKKKKKKKKKNKKKIKKKKKKKKKRKKKRKCLFGGTVPLKTNQYFFFFEPNVLCLGKEKKKHHLRSFLILYTLPSVTIFSKLFSIHFLWCWPGEFKASKVGNYVLYSHDVNEWFNSITNC